MDELDNRKKKYKLQFLKALITNMVYHLGIPERPIPKKNSTSTVEIGILDESNSLEFFLENFSLDGASPYNKSKYIDFKHLIYTVIDKYYILTSQHVRFLNSPYMGTELNVPYTEINDIQSRQMDIFSELDTLYIKTGYDKPNTKAEFIVLYNLKRGMSSGEIAFLNLFSNLYDFISKNKNPIHSDYVLLLDEGDLGFHPQWKKKYINLLLKSLPHFFEKGKNLQIFITTHDPLTLSDFPSSNVVFLTRDGVTNEGIQSTFAANIAELLSNSFFINDGLIGDFAKSKITDVIKWITSVKDNNTLKGELRNETLKELVNKKAVINLIDERVLKIKLTEMVLDVEDDKALRIKQLEEELAQLRKQ